MEIKVVKNEQELKELFYFIARTFYLDAIQNNERYYILQERYNEMKEQFNIDNNMLMYIEREGNIIAGITGKNMSHKYKSINIGVLAVTYSERGKDFAKMLIKEFENKCIERAIEHIKLGARFRAAFLYQKLDYNFSLMIQVFDFVNINEIRKNNKYNFKEKEFF